MNCDNEKASPPVMQSELDDTKKHIVPSDIKIRISSNVETVVLLERVLKEM